MLLSALIELRSERDEEALTADGLDVSPSGLAVRAAFVPEVGTRLYCDFRCPPEDDAVHALTEVVWSAWDGPHSGSFGLRFLELDTKSATTIRRYIAPEVESAAPVEQKRVANMHIDGLGTPIEADVRLLEKDCIVLEQELGFLRLGRGIAVDVPGRGTQRGRIASIELRQGPLDTPTLVFGVLLDEQKVTADLRPTHPADVGDAGGGPRYDGESTHPDLDVPEALAHPPAPAELEGHELGEVPVPDGELSTPVRAARAARPRRSDDQPRVVRVERGAVSDEDSAEAAALQNRLPESLIRLRSALRTCWLLVRTRLYPLLSGLLARAKERAAGDEDGSLGERARSKLAAARVLVGAQWNKLRARKKRRTTAPTPRVQRSQTARVQRNEPIRRPRNRRLLTLALAAFGVGLGVYALAPRSGADRIRLRTHAPAEAEVERPAEPAPSAPVTKSLASEALPSAEPQASEPSPSSAAPLASEPQQEPTATPSKAQRAARFGEDEVPNGRTFVLRMSGPVRTLEGEKREDGFTVRIPGRLALDRASPIASSHRAIARALILNRGEYAELTVEFLPGMRPKYQVAGKDSTIEVTLERP